jgi:hypothetical protein
MKNFKTGALNHSATFPWLIDQTLSTGAQAQRGPGHLFDPRGAWHFVPMEIGGRTVRGSRAHFRKYWDFFFGQRIK